MIRGDFLPKLRADDHKRFFDLRDVEVCTAKAIEQNFDFVVEIVATLAPEPVGMAHAGWKAGKLSVIKRDVFSSVPLRILFFSLKFGTMPGGFQNSC